MEKEKKTEEEKNDSERLSNFGDESEELKRQVVEAEEKFKKKFQRRKLLSAIIMTSIYAVVMTMWFQQLGGRKEYVEKSGIKDKIARVIINGGSLETVKHAFNSRNVIVKRSLIKKEDQSSVIEEYYDNEKLTLVDVINDIIVDYYYSRAYRDTIYEKEKKMLHQLESTVEELQRNNPFDELEIEQRVLFQNVQTKLSDTNYGIIKEDMSLISKTLREKNTLTKEYLDKSNSSFWISILAVIITTIFGVIQLIQNSNKKRKDEGIYKQKNEKPSQTE